MQPYAFDHRYRESLLLSDGTMVAVRLVRPDDKELLRRGFERLSDHARYNRFFVHKSTLLDGEVRYLTEVDQVDHFALVVVRRAVGGREEGMAVARAVRLAVEPDVYEGAVTVIDAFQRRGIGTLLIRRLVEGVTERDGRQLRFCVLPANRAMQRLLARAVPQGALRSEDGLVRVDVALDAAHRRRAVCAG